jgi:SRSO17 transposase
MLVAVKGIGKPSVARYGIDESGITKKGRHSVSVAQQ